MRFTLNFKTLENVNYRVRSFFEALAALGWRDLSSLSSIDLKQPWTLAQAVEQAPRLDRGALQYTVAISDAGSAGGGLSWRGSPRSLAEPFDDGGIVISDPSSPLMARLPAVITTLCESVGAVYGYLAPSGMIMSRNKHKRSNRALLNGLPGWMPGVWLRTDLFEAVGDARARRAGLTVSATSSGRMLLSPNWQAAGNEELDQVERAIGPEFFFHGETWSSYPRWPLSYLADTLPNPGRATTLH